MHLATLGEGSPKREGNPHGDPRLEQPLGQLFKDFAQKVERIQDH